jgi:hypothetical protein
MAIALLPQGLRDNYEVHEWRHASAILQNDFVSEYKDLIAMLSEFKLCRSYISNPGGNKSSISTFFDSFLYSRGWIEKHFDTKILIDEREKLSPTHKIDCYKNGIALEIEWNNKDPFFDRDLNNFRLLFDLTVISVGVIVTRSDELQDIFKELGRGSSYGESTTHIRKLLPKIEGRGGGGCPILVFGIKPSLYDEDC